MSIPATRAQLADAALRQRQELRPTRARRKPRRRALANLLRWSLARLRKIGRKLNPQMIDDAIDLAVDAAVPAIDLGDSPFADDAEDFLQAALDRDGRRYLHEIANHVWDDLADAVLSDDDDAGDP